jgi:hypothetical protein
MLVSNIFYIIYHNSYFSAKLNFKIYFCYIFYIPKDILTYTELDNIK